MKYSISSNSRGTVLKHSMSFILLAGVLALSPWKAGQAQTGSEEGSTDSARNMGAERGTRNPGDTGTYGTPGNESGTRNRGNTSSPGTTGSENDTRSRGTNGSKGSKRRGGSDTGIDTGTDTAPSGSGDKGGHGSSRSTD